MNSFDMCGVWVKLRKLIPAKDHYKALRIIIDEATNNCGWDQDGYMHEWEPRMPEVRRYCHEEWPDQFDKDGNEIEQS